MDRDGLIALAVAAIVGGRVGYRRFMGWRAQRRAALVEFPPSPIAALPDGTAQVTGCVRALGTTLRAPLSDRPCVGFRLQIDIKTWGGWEAVIDRVEMVSFAVVDDSAEAVVEAGHTPPSRWPPASSARPTCSAGSANMSAGFARS